MSGGGLSGWSVGLDQAEVVGGPDQVQFVVLSQLPAHVGHVVAERLCTIMFFNSDSLCKISFNSGFPGSDDRAIALSLVSWSVIPFVIACWLKGVCHLPCQEDRRNFSLKARWQLRWSRVRNLVCGRKT